MKVLMVGGRWDGKGGRASGLFRKLVEEVSRRHDADAFNGGMFGELSGLLGRCPGYDCVFWMADVPNDLDKTRDVKKTAPHVMLVTSKRNDSSQYDERELVLRALESKSNLLVEFSKGGGGVFNMRALDPLGNIWYDGADVPAAAGAVMERISFLKSMTREGSRQEDSSPSLPDQSDFVTCVREIAGEIQELVKETTEDPRFLGNASFRETRCMKTFPSFRDGGGVFVSRRNVPKRFIGLDDFVAVHLAGDGVGYRGEHKPSVDTPIQLRLYRALPNINYMIHTHCYIEGAPFTGECIPCGAVEEAAAVIEVILAAYGDLGQGLYKVNLRGHGSIAMSGDLSGFEGIGFYSRPMPERQC